MHVWITMVFVVFFVVSVAWYFTRLPNTDTLYAHSATLTMDPPVVPVMVPPLETVSAENATSYIKHTRKGCKSYVNFTTTQKTLIASDFIEAINTCEDENLTGTSGYRCVGTVLDKGKWNNCIELELQPNAGTWVNAAKAAAVSYVSRKTGSQGGKFLARSDLGCKRVSPLTGVTDLQGALDACDKFVPSEINGKCLGVVNNATAGWQRCLELQPDHDTAVWVKDTKDTELNY